MLFVLKDIHFPTHWCSLDVHLHLSVPLDWINPKENRYFFPITKLIDNLTVHLLKLFTVKNKINRKLKIILHPVRYEIRYYRTALCTVRRMNHIDQVARGCHGRASSLVALCTSKKKYLSQLLLKTSSTNKQVVSLLDCGALQLWSVKMLNSLFVNHQDQKEALAIERRRRFEESRKQRIFNARRRIIGVRPPHNSKNMIETLLNPCSAIDFFAG